MSVRNAGSGIAVMHGWKLVPDWIPGSADRPEVDDFHRLTRDLYVAAGDVGFWQGALRNAADPEYAWLRDAAASGQRVVVDVLYGDYEGGQRTISRFSMQPRDDGSWYATVARHWNVDRPDPR
jgi:hypothetical protein